ncbi:MAG TPA: hypothetical protein VF808_05645 [Ktedonobacterales bacterium]
MTSLLQRGAEEPRTLSVLLVGEGEHLTQRSAMLMSNPHLADVQVRALAIPSIPASLRPDEARASIAPAETSAHGRAARPLAVWRYVWVMWRALQARETTIIHCSSIRMTYVALCARWLLAISHPRLTAPAIVTELARSKIPEKAPHATQLLRPVSDAIVVESSADRDALMRLGIRGAHIHLAPQPRPGEPEEVSAWLKIWAVQVRALYMAAVTVRRQRELPYLGLAG